MHVCVLGAGVVGLATAYALTQAGHQVTVIDRATPGAGTSGGNGAQLSYSYVQPLADPSIWRQLPKLLLAPDSPLKLRLQADAQQWAWGLRFMQACKASTSLQTTTQLLALATTSRAAFDQMMQAEQLACDFAASGKLVIYSDAQAFGAAQKQLVLQQALGSVQTAQTAMECVAIEPALQHYQAHIQGGIYTASECAVDSQKLCDGLVAVLRRLTGRHHLPAGAAAVADSALPAAVHAAAAAAGVELAPALARLGGKVGVYRRMLARFEGELADLPAELQADMAQGDELAAARRLHTLRGVAATLGVNDLAARAAQTEKQLAAGGKAADPRQSMAELGDAISAAARGLRGLLRALLPAPLPAQQTDGDGPAAAAATATGALAGAVSDPAALRSGLKTLSDLLRQSDMAALDTLAGLQRQHPQALGGRLVQLDELVAGLDFVPALARCRELLAELDS